MTQKTSYFPLGGGLDLSTPAIAVGTGRARAALNYESDATGYRRISGYERFDGRLSPTAAFAAAASEIAGELALEAARAAILPIPGSGPVRGVQWYKGIVYAWRDNEAGDKGVMWGSSPAGWVQITDAFPAGGRYELINYNFYGSSDFLRMYGCNGVGQSFEYDGTTLTFINTGMGSKDKAHRIAAHKNHLFLAFAGGSLQHSALGNPLSWTPILGAGELGIGDEITDLLSSTVGELAILGAGSVNVLFGNDAADWQINKLSEEAGALPWTAERMGTALYMDNRGVRNLTATQSYGNFELGTITQPVAKLIRTKLGNNVLPTASTRLRARDTYRVFFSDGSGLSIYMGKKYPETMAIDLGRVVRCICSVEDPNQQEMIFFGSDDGFVYQMERGRSFDGQPITFYLRLPFNHMGGPQIRKRWHKAVLETTATSATTLRITGEVDYGDPDEPSIANRDLTISGGGGFWDTVVWDQFYWGQAAEGTAEAYLDVVGRNMSLLIGGETAREDPHVLQGLTLYYSARGLVR